MSIRRVGAGIDPRSARPISLRGLAVRRTASCFSSESAYVAAVGKHWSGIGIGI